MPRDTQRWWSSSIVIKLLCVVTLFLSSCASQKLSVSPSPKSSPTSIQIVKTITPTLSQTPYPTYTPTATPTMDANTTLALEFDVPAACLFADTYLVSKDQNWIAADCNLYRELLIKQRNGSQITIPYQELSDLDPAYFTIKPLSWSSDNRLFYFTTLVKCCLGFLPFNNANTYGSLYQFDATNKTWSRAIRDVYRPLYYFSNDGERYVSLNHFPPDTTTLPEYLELRITEVSSNKSKRAVFKYVRGPIDGEDPTFAWSESGDEFAIVLYRLYSASGDVLMLQDVLLRIDFVQWELELIVDYDESNLLGE